jgi:hypothetical protein
METKFNLYDLFAIFIPGTTLWVGVSMILAGVGAIQLSDIDWTATLLLLPLAYVTGTAIHQYTRVLVSVEGLPSQLLSNEDTTFTAAFKEHLWGKIQAAFPVSDFQGNLAPGAPQAGVAQQQRQHVGWTRRLLSSVFERLIGWWWTFGSPATPQRPEDAVRQMAFDLCYDYVIQKGKGVYTENMNALYGMCRNMLTVVFLLALLATASSTWWVFNRLATNPDRRYIEILVWIILLAGTWISAWWFRSEFHKGMTAHAKRFVVSVYRSFYLDRLNFRHNER